MLICYDADPGGGVIMINFVCTDETYRIIALFVCARDVPRSSYRLQDAVRRVHGPYMEYYQNTIGTELHSIEDLCHFALEGLEAHTIKDIELSTDSRYHEWWTLFSCGIIEYAKYADRLTYGPISQISFGVNEDYVNSKLIIFDELESLVEDDADAASERPTLSSQSMLRRNLNLSSDEQQVRIDGLLEWLRWYGTVIRRTIESVNLRLMFRQITRLALT